jgi:hypothetical protein
MNACASAVRAAAATSSSDACGRPYAMLSRIDPANSVICCDTNEIASRRSSSFTSRRSTPSIVMRPACGS